MHARMAMLARERRWQALMRPGASTVDAQGLAPGPDVGAAWRAPGLTRPSTGGGVSLAALQALGPERGRGSWPSRPSTAPPTASRGPQRWRAPAGSISLHPGQGIARPSSARTFMQERRVGHERATAFGGRIVTVRHSEQEGVGQASAAQNGAEGGDSGDSCKPSAGAQRPGSASGASARRAPSSSAAGAHVSGFSPRVSRFRPSTAPSPAAGSPSEPGPGQGPAERGSKGLKPGSEVCSATAPYASNQVNESPGYRDGLTLATSYGTATSLGLPHARPLHARAGPQSIAADCSSRAMDGGASRWPAGSEPVQQPGTAVRAVPLERNAPIGQASALPVTLKATRSGSAGVSAVAQDRTTHEAGVACERAGGYRGSVASRRWRPSSAADPVVALYPSSMDPVQAPSARATAAAPGRAATAPAALVATLGMPAGVRLARPGSGGSPTSRREQCHAGRPTWYMKILCITT